VGQQALNANTTASNNTAIGFQSLLANTTGSPVTAVGAGALTSNTTGSYNVGVGWQALETNSVGSFNVAVGDRALISNTTASNNTAVGYQAAYNSTQNNQTAVGFQALLSATTGGEVALGAYSLTSVTTGVRNTGLGTAAGQGTTTASDNTFVGYHSAYANTTGASNTAIGTQALRLNTTANNNTAVGYQAGYSNTTATGKTTLGAYSGYLSTAGGYSTFVGYAAGYNSTGSGNTFIGTSAAGAGAGEIVTTGSKNTILGGYNGNQGGLDIRTANNHIVLSDGDGNPRVIVNASGNVGIGGTPAEKLDVVGNIKASGTATVGGIYNSSLYNQSVGNIAFWVTNVGEACTIQQNTGHVEVTTGNLIIGTAGKGIDFDPAGGGAANLLDDYEEGTWTPTLNMSSGSVSYISQLGQYTKIGNQVTLTGWIYIDGISSPSGDVYITAPFTASSTLTRPATMIMANNTTGVTGNIGMWVNPNTQTMYLQIVNNADLAAFDGSNIASSTELYVTITYITT
jgi:hypothetical protein